MQAVSWSIIWYVFHWNVEHILYCICNLVPILYMSERMHVRDRGNKRERTRMCVFSWTIPVCYGTVADAAFHQIGGKGHIAAIRLASPSHRFSCGSESLDWISMWVQVVANELWLKSRWKWLRKLVALAVKTEPVSFKVAGLAQRSQKLMELWVTDQLHSVSEKAVVYISSLYIYYIYLLCLFDCS